MESSDDRSGIDPPKDRQRSAITNGRLLQGVDGRSAWARRAKDILAAHASDIPDPSAAEKSLIRRAAVLTVELEKLEIQFAEAPASDPELLALYGTTAGNLRRLLEAVGLRRRARDITPSLDDILREAQS